MENQASAPWPLKHQGPETNLHNKNEKNSVDKITRGKSEFRFWGVGFFVLFLLWFFWLVGFVLCCCCCFNLVLQLISSFIFSKTGKEQLQP